MQVPVVQFIYFADFCMSSLLKLQKHVGYVWNA